MRILSSVILLCCSLWMTIYLYGEYAISSAKYHHLLVVFPIALFILSLILYLYSIEGREDKESKKND